MNNEINYKQRGTSRPVIKKLMCYLLTAENFRTIKVYLFNLTFPIVLLLKLFHITGLLLLYNFLLLRFSICYLGCHLR